MTTQTHPQPQYVMCKACCRTLPVDQFRHRWRGRPNRIKQCRACHNAAERLRRAALRSRAGQRVMAKHMTRLKNQRTSRQIAAVCSGMLDAFGGVGGFMDRWQRSFKRDLRTGGYAAFRHFESLFRLLQYCDRLREAKPDYSRMTDEELLDAISRIELGEPLRG